MAKQRRTAAAAAPSSSRGCAEGATQRKRRKTSRSERALSDAFGVGGGGRLSRVEAESGAPVELTAAGAAVLFADEDDAYDDEDEEE